MGSEGTDLRQKNLWSWPDILNSRQVAAVTEENLANQQEVLCRGISCIYLSLSNKWKACHKAINSRPSHLRMTLE